MASEDPPEDVHLVDQDVAQPAQEGRPASVVGEQPGVEHVGVGEHHIGVAPDPGSHPRFRVPVEAGGHQTGQPEVDEGPELVVGQSLGRVQAQGTGRWPEALVGVEEGLGDGELVAQGLPRGRPRGHHHRGASSGQLEGHGLVRPQRPGQQGRQRRSQRRHGLAISWRPNSQPLEMDECRVSLDHSQEPVEGHLHHDQRYRLSCEREAKRRQ